jgi:excisionase family DNA binding protein
MHPRDYGLTRATYSVNETARILSIGKTSIYELIKTGELVRTKVGRRTLFSAPDIAAFLNKRRQQTMSVSAVTETQERD